MRTTRWLSTIALAVILLLAAGCADINPYEAPPPLTGDADFSVMVSLGNSLTAGFQNNGLNEVHQRRSFAALLARQVGKQVLSDQVEAAAPTEFVIPGYGAPGSPGTLDLVSLTPPTIEPIQLTGQPLNTGYPAPYNNLAVPGANVHDVLYTAGGNASYNLILRGQGTMIQQAAALHPTFVTLWIGPNDVLGAALNATVTALTPVNDFRTDYEQLLDTLQGLDSRPGIVAANVPDVTSIPYVTTVPVVLVDPTTRQPVLVNGQPVPLLGPAGPLGPGDYLTLKATPLIAQGFGIPSGVPGSNGQPLPDGVVLDHGEAAAIQQRVADINAVIAQACGDRGIPVVDTNALLRRVATHGIEVGGIEYTDAFLTGGIFSLDGFHPTDVAQGIVANAFIRTINARWNASIPLVNLAELMGVDYRPPVAEKPAPAGFLFSEANVAAVEAMVRSPWFRILSGD